MGRINDSLAETKSRPKTDTCGPAIVTGAGSGIGRQVALELAKQAVPTLAVDLDAMAADETAKLAGSCVVPWQADVSSEDDVAGYVSAATRLVGSPSCFFNNAGVAGVTKPIGELALNDWTRTLAINLTGVFLGLKYVLPLLMEQGRGAIVNSGSTLSVRGMPERADYVAAKHGVLGLTRVAALEGAPYGVRVNCINPGPIETPLMVEADRDAAAQGLAVTGANRRRAIPAGRYGRVDEIASIVVFLLRMDLTFMTGASINVDGGMTARLA